MVKWRKILYQRQPFPDNYSGGRRFFLNELKKNVSVVTYSYRNAVYGILNFVTHLDIVILFFILFEQVSRESLDIHNLTIVISILVTFSYIIFVYQTACISSRLVDDLYTIVCLLLFGFGLTPMIRTLTETISTDTIYAMSMLSALVSFIFHDYGIKAPLVSLPLSLSSGLSSAVFLISRLQSNESAFFLLAVAFCIHACLPSLRNHLFSRFCVVSVVGSSVIICSTICALWQLFPELALLLLLFHVFVIAVCPYILIIKQGDKRNLHGPWDEARPGKLKST